jgi:hypothetical protein
VKLDLYCGIDAGGCDGWVAHLVEAHTNAGPAGYLIIAFIPPKEMARCYPSPLEWAVRKEGYYSRIRDLLNKPDAEWDRQELLLALTTTDYSYGYNYRHTEEDRSTCSASELRELWRARRQSITDEYRSGYEDFCRWHLNRPLVDYIQAYDEDELRPYRRGQRQEQKQPLGKSCQHLGIGTVMYETGALWMHQLGLNLHGAGLDLQSEEAQGAWAALRGRGLVKNVTLLWRGEKQTRQVLDTGKLLLQFPELADFTVEG